MRQKTAERKEGKKRMALEVDLENVAAPFVELLDGFIKQMELVVGSLSRINKGIWALVDGVKDLVEAMRKKEVSETDRDQEIVEVGVQTVEETEIEKVNKETEMEFTRSVCPSPSRWYPEVKCNFMFRAFLREQKKQDTNSELWLEVT
jgi:hypothetical protein